MRFHAGWIRRVLYSFGIHPSVGSVHGVQEVIV